MTELHAAEGLLDQLVGPQISAAWVLLAVFGGPLFKWAAEVVTNWRADRRASGDSISEKMASMIKLLSAELDRTTAISTRFGADLERLREARWTLEDQMQELRDQAIAARAMVHELQRRLGIAETDFPPLPHPILAGSRAPPGP